jgi:hypothetical protein
LVDVDGDRLYRVSNCDWLPPFLVTLVSSSDHWLFVASNGAVTAGRRSPDEPLFPYVTDDKLYDSVESTGPKTILRVDAGGATSLWEPFSQRYDDLYRVSRSVAKSVYGDRIRFEEVNDDLGLCFAYTWLTSERFGFLRRVSLVSLRDDPVSVDVLDGFQNLMPHGVGHRFQMELSTLADAYKRADLDAGTGLGLIRLSAVPVDRAEPSEALRATTVWSSGLEPAARLLSSAQLEDFRRGGEVGQEDGVRGQRGAYFVSARLELGPREGRGWQLVADVAQDAAAVSDLIARLRDRADLEGEIEQDVQRGRRELVRLVASADGLQASEDEASQWRHFSDALFNVMRGGVPERGYWISRARLASHIGRVNRDVARRQAMFAHSLPEQLSHVELLARVAERDDPDLVRIVSEYMPLTFSRRHGDPSRPWNVFSIESRDERGERVLGYQGNWRDIFQNWEALALSFPGYLESMVFKFLDASTADGHNPYRITHEGCDWERPDPHGVWSSIGYWGDHQIVYLLRLLELSRRFHPGQLERLLTQRVFAFANVPYRIHDYEALLSDPQQTIDFDAELDARIVERLPTLGQDARALVDRDGIRHASLAEKLLVTVLARLTSFVPGGGIWMNTQRPEWNDANNALVGRGLSLVTLCHLRRFLVLARDLFATLGGNGIQLAPELAELVGAVRAALQACEPALERGLDARERKALLDRLGRAGSQYRRRVYAAGFSAGDESVTGDELATFCELALRHLDRTIRENRREDGLYHAYNLMEPAGEQIRIERLPEMLEGQVAVLSSGFLSAGEALEVLDALRSSRLYREDQQSYLLYPDKAAPGFLEQNTIPPAEIERSRLLSSLIERGDRRIVVRDAAGAGPRPPSPGWRRRHAGWRPRRRRSCWRSTSGSSTTTPSPAAPGASRSTRGWGASTGTWSRSCDSPCRRRSWRRRRPEPTRRCSSACAVTTRRSARGSASTSSLRSTGPFRSIPTRTRRASPVRSSPA